MDELMEKGKANFNTKCASCHQINGQGLPPALDEPAGHHQQRQCRHELVRCAEGGPQRAPLAGDVGLLLAEQQARAPLRVGVHVTIAASTVALYRWLRHLRSTAEEIRDWLRDFVKRVKDGEYDDKLVYRKRLRKDVEEYTKNLPQHVKAARLLPEAGGTVYYVITKRGPIPIELKHTDIDYNHYIEKQLKPVADSILVLLN